MSFTLLSITLLTLMLGALTYLYLLAVASISIPPISLNKTPKHLFSIVIPAHNEEKVILRTVQRLKQLDYPQEMFNIHVVADYCTDQTAQNVRSAGGTAHERQDGERGSKGAALEWLFKRILNRDAEWQPDAVVIFDADTSVDPQFLRVMDTRLTQGDRVIQGQHRISNPDDGWFPALTWAMFLIDNRFQNLGRSNLGWSAKHMGDSICFHADILRKYGWGTGLTEDYAFRHLLLLKGIRIRYEPAAIGNGEAAQDWKTARAQRARWLRGTHDASQEYGRRLLKEGIRRRDPALLDGAAQVRIPAYSTLTILSGGIWLLHLILDSCCGISGTLGNLSLTQLWFLVLIALFIYPLWGLLLERAPIKAFWVILSGPVFILWRTWLAFTSRYRMQQVEWLRTPRRE